MNIEALQVLAGENIASIRDVQKNPSRALKGVTRVMRGRKTIGFFFANAEWEELQEDMEMAGSKQLRTLAAKSRAGKARGVSLQTLAKRYGV